MLLLKDPFRFFSRVGCRSLSIHGTNLGRHHRLAVAPSAREDSLITQVPVEPLALASVYRAQRPPRPEKSSFACPALVLDRVRVCLSLSALVPRDVGVRC